MNERITIAMPKGRIFEDAVQLLKKAGFQLPDEFDENRKLTLEVEGENLSFILAKPMDVATYVEYGVADLGIAGKDVMMEEERDVYELLDLQISPCYLAVAGLPDTRLNDVAPRIASKYPNVASEYFRKQGEQVEIIKLNGSIELGPLIGLAERIVDIVSSGRTLKENGLVEYEKIADVTSRLIANPASYQLKEKRIAEIVERLEQVI
ncbi:ATP phosphoribosyltransferase [Bacillus testis]|uniref:ATP phosphoribosyltransferase n=1 Tax=Bacillus testis TaxID=1622072 RepID=UPI00067F361A|nr:ATP phosphoribosyltransferase [Bacillus testis]